jgi:coronin-1B/1C/6
MLSFHPCVEEILASASFDNTVNVWNIQNAQSYTKIVINETPVSLDWNYNGSLIGVTTKEKMVHVADPRTNKITLSTKCSESTKPQKMGFLDSNYLFSCGVSKTNERQIRLFDMRNFNEACSTLMLDTQTGTFMPYYDCDTGLIFLPGRGEGNIKVCEFSNSTIKYATEYRSSVPQKGIGAFPKRAMNYNKCELTRFAKLTINTIEYLSFYFPKRVEGYDASVYPDCFCGESSLTAEEWISGEDRDVKRKNITTLDNAWCTSDLAFDKKEEEKVNSQDNSGQIEDLRKMIERLSCENSELKERNESLQDQSNELQAQLSQESKANGELSDKISELLCKVDCLTHELETSLQVNDELKEKISELQQQ